MDLAALLVALKDNLLRLGARRLAILGAVGLFVFSAVGIGSYFLSKSRLAPIYVGLTANDSSRMAAALESFGVPFEVSADGSQVSVSPDNTYRARALLAERGLPTHGAAGYELFDKLGPLGLTSFMQEVTRVRALEGEIARTIQSMRNVRSARVHIAIGESAGFRRNAQPSTASVVVRFDGTQSQYPVQAIRQLVAAAVPALALENVRVMSADGTVLAAGGDEANGGSSRMVDLERTISRQLQNNISLTLAPHLGRENFETSVAVRLNLDKKQTSENVFDPESKVERSVRVVKETGSALNAANKSSTSVEQNIPGAGDAGPGGPQSQKSNQRRDEVTNYEISSKATTTTSEGYRLENVTVAVVINRKKLVQPDGKPLTDQAMNEKIAEMEKLIAAASGVDQKRGDRVTVSALDFASDPAGSEAQGSGFLATLGNHTGTLIVAVAIVIVTLLIVWFGLRPLARSLAGPRADMPGLPQLGNEAAGEAREQLFTPAVAPMLSDSNEPQFGAAPQFGNASDALGDLAPSPAERLDRLVGLDRDRALAVLRRWISEERTQ
ncbi:MAG: flagellar M-ring protein FliF [Hyphomicrobium sp.]|nr:MAG: flagellar M-ring protein FliF [Hyphomicrobium sp.]